MEHQEFSIFRTEDRLEVEMPKASEVINGVPVPLQLSCNKASEVINGVPVPLQLSCNTFCVFSKKESNISDSEHRSKSAAKLYGLITFYVVSMAIEIGGGVKANSLAVLTDAAHLLTDIAGFSISLFAIWASGWQATSRQSFGFSRLEVLGALVSTQLIWLTSGILIYEAFDRIFHKYAKVDGELMFAVAVFGFVINLIMVVWLGHDHSGHACMGKDHHHDHDHEREELCATMEEGNTLLSDSPKISKSLNINLQGAYLHVVVDLIQSVGVMIAGSIIWAEPDWLVVDLICTLIFSVFSLSTTLPMLRNIFYILMERTPNDIDIASLENGLKCIDGVHDVHDLHVWAITVGKIVLVCHIMVEPGVDSNEILHKIRHYCEKKHKIHHVTVQIEG